MFILIPFVTLMKLKSYISLPLAFASPPPKMVPPMVIFEVIKFLLLTAFLPMFTVVIPYNTEVFAPP